MILQKRGGQVPGLPEGTWEGWHRASPSLKASHPSKGGSRTARCSFMPLPEATMVPLYASHCLPCWSGRSWKCPSLTHKPTKTDLLHPRCSLSEESHVLRPSLFVPIWQKENRGFFPTIKELGVTKHGDACLSSQDWGGRSRRLRNPGLPLAR